MMENIVPGAATETLNTEPIKENWRKIKGQMMDKTSEAFETTSKKMDNAVVYLKNHKPGEMVEDVQKVVRQHPGKSVLVGLMLGMVIGKILKR